MNNQVANVIIKSHPKSVIRPVAISSPLYFSLFSNATPTAWIDGVTQNVIVLQATKIDNYFIVEFVSKKNYDDSKEDVIND